MKQLGKLQLHSQIRPACKKLAREKHSSLSWISVSDEEAKLL